MSAGFWASAATSFGVVLGTALVTLAVLRARRRRLRCPACGERLDEGLPPLEVPSPAGLTMAHALVCQAVRRAKGEL